ncbi:LicD family protein [Arthrobacter sp. SAFR-179]|uniref:LicD family protein n=1 Tax=Arthrobacter sp. SAFR-179 TaxID=3387279 RepID=UPI003F7B6E0B
MGITDGELKALHEKQLSILVEIERICRSNGINYFAIAGTLLGAVRHKGFIPWDDDIDLGMLRSDYERFVACAKNDLGEDYFLQTWHTDPAFGLPMAKIRLQGTKLVEAASANVACHQGIFVDIFPFDARPDSRVRRLAHSMSAYILKRVMLDISGYSVGADCPPILRVVLKLVSAAAGLVPKRSLVRLFERQMQQFNGITTEECVTVAGSYGYKRECIKSSWTQELTGYSFESVSVPGFGHADQYLTRLYGDYHELPPVNKRGSRHGILSISLRMPDEGVA